METAYSIADREPYRPGADGTWTVQRDEPAIVSRLVLGFAPGSAPTWVAIDGAPDPTRARDADRGRETLTFEAGPIDALPYPRGTGSSAGIPRVVWSTWKDWAALGTAIQGRFDAALEIDDELRTAFLDHLEKARTPNEKLREIAAFVGDSTRLIEYPIGWSPGPRSAARTWATAYGTRIDRAVLAAALYREAGFTASLAFVGHPASEAGRRVPSLDWSDGPAVRVRGEAVSGCFDPSDASYSRGEASLYGRAVWEPSRDDEPSRPVPPDAERSRLELLLDLAYDGEKQAWKGTGVLTATHALCPFDHMAGLDGEAQEYLGALAGSVLHDAEVTGFNPDVFDRSHVVAGFVSPWPTPARSGSSSRPRRFTSTRKRAVAESTCPPRSSVASSCDSTPATWRSSSCPSRARAPTTRGSSSSPRSRERTESGSCVTSLWHRTVTTPRSGPICGRCCWPMPTREADCSC
jgi:hypothetical protein